MAMGRSVERELSRQMSLLKAATTTRINDDLTPQNVTAIHGETAMLVCTVLNVVDKAVSWLRNTTPIPQLLAVNNITNTLDPRYKALVSRVNSQTEFVLVISDVKPKDSGEYQCQVSGPKHSSMYRDIVLRVIESITEIEGGPEIHVDKHSTLQLTCSVFSGDKTPAYIIWQRDDKILKFDGGETSDVKYLNRDTHGRHYSTLIIEDIQLDDSGEYTCQPAAGAPTRVTVHVLQRETEVQAVLGEGGEETVPAVTLPTLPPVSASSSSSIKRIQYYFIFMINLVMIEYLCL